MIIVAVALLLLLALIIRPLFKKKKPNAIPKEEIIKGILEKEVRFYQNLSSERKAGFYERVANFLSNVKVIGVDTTVDDTDKTLVAAAAIIPIFEFEGWAYTHINEVLLYPKPFDQNFNFEGENHIVGMVGNGAMQSTVILSKPFLRDGFMNDNNDSNTAIHEFVHLIDKADGATDGVPEVLLQHKYSLPWIKLMKDEMEKIRKGESDIDTYAASSETEFFAVVSEYFFKQPRLLKEQHPELYARLKTMFGHKTKV
ncbi:M90 family metallopeptidase [Lacihabitans lacunae]|uniref:Zinc-dependent peptidase n=1 Tax=Lacihabitans lacunae TaxID=1028214 RepID=A0ABV7YZ24_9BACT